MKEQEPVPGSNGGDKKSRMVMVRPRKKRVVLESHELITARYGIVHILY